MTTDSIADFIIQLKNGGRAGKSSVHIPFSRLKQDIAALLKREGYVTSFAKRGKRGDTLEVALAYDAEGSRIKGVKRVSKPSRRLYAKAGELRGTRAGGSITVVSTPAGVLTGSEARRRNVGGEVLFEIW